jgi:hypothetical protein
MSKVGSAGHAHPASIDKEYRPYMAAAIREKVGPMLDILPGPAYRLEHLDLCAAAYFIKSACK